MEVSATVNLEIEIESEVYILMRKGSDVVLKVSPDWDSLESLIDILVSERIAERDAFRISGPFHISQTISFPLGVK